MFETPLPLFRRLLPWVASGLYLLMTVLALFRVNELRRSINDRVVESLERRVTGAVALWEDRLIEELDAGLDGPVEVERAAQRQERLRRRPFIAALYLWAPDRGPRGRDGYRLVFPTETSVDRPDSLARRPCVLAAKALTRTDLEPAELARLWIAGCANDTPSVRLYAASEAASMLDQAGFTEMALVTLEIVDPPGGPSLASAAALGVPPARLALVRNQRNSLLDRLGRTMEADQGWARNATEIASLDAPDAAALGHLLRWPMLPRLRRNSDPDAAQLVEIALAACERRVAAWREITARVLTDPPSLDASPLPRFSWDQYSADPFALYTTWHADGTGGAIQVEPAALLDTLLARPELSSVRSHLVVREGGGDIVAGARRGGPVIVDVGLPRTLRWLRLGIRRGAVDDEIASASEGWIVPFVIVLLTFVLGVIALAAQARAGGQERALLRRQREFSTRVTHELKTPLAGIRVMAENLEMGAFQNEAQHADMAHGIVREVDRLTRRVDEILSVARAATIPNPQPFDPEEMVLEAVDEWGPRLEATGVRLIAEELDSTDAVMGDGAAVRDAVSCLLDNALKYRREDRIDATVWLSLRQERDVVVITVADNGLGVPSELRAAIFEPYVRVEGDGRGHAGGYGLGLAQVAAIVRVHHGKVACLAGVDGGSSFEIRLPVATTKA